VQEKWVSHLEPERRQFTLAAKLLKPKAREDHDILRLCTDLDLIVYRHKYPSPRKLI